MNPAPGVGRRDRPVLAIGAVLGGMAILLVVVGLAQIRELPTCESITGDADGTGGSPCRDGLDVGSWPNEALVSLVASVPFVVLSAVALTVGWRRR